MTKPLPRPEIEFVPMRLFAQYIAKGWAMVPGYPLNPRDYAVLMLPPLKHSNNRSAARRSRLKQQEPA